MAEILVVDDDPHIREMLARILRRAGHTAALAANLAEALDQAAAAPLPVVLLDLDLPDGNGLDIIADLKASPGAPEVVIITGSDHENSAETAFKYGAWDYLRKPFHNDEVALTLGRALQYAAEKQEAPSVIALDRVGIVGGCAAITASLDEVAQAASGDSPVLVAGETGTGKELFARAIHANSGRRGSALVVVDCAALPANLVESTLFGHRKGAFTGADREQVGLIKQADGGTLFLDEVGELPLEVQRAFLRVLQEKTFRPVGASREQRSDFRLVAATNRDLAAMVEAGTFREDLHFRLNAFCINLPPLRERGEDLQELLLGFLVRACTAKGIVTKGHSPEFMATLQRYPWPGNVRELNNTVERAVSAAGGDPILHPTHLPAAIRAAAVNGTASSTRPPGSVDDGQLPALEDLPALGAYRQQAAEAAEARYLEQLMRRTGGKIKAAREISGLSKSRLYELIKKYGV